MSRAAIEQFARQKYLNLETFKKDGSGVKTPLWFAEDGGILYAYTLADSWKVKRIRNNPRARIAPCDMRGNVTGDWVEAQAAIVDPSEAQRAHQLLNEKYGWVKKIGNFFSKLRGKKHAVIRIRPG